MASRCRSMFQQVGECTPRGCTLPIVLTRATVLLFPLRRLAEDVAAGRYGGLGANGASEIAGSSRTFYLIALHAEPMRTSRHYHTTRPRSLHPAPFAQEKPLESSPCCFAT